MLKPRSKRFLVILLTLFLLTVGGTPARADQYNSDLVPEFDVDLEDIIARAKWAVDSERWHTAIVELQKAIEKGAKIMAPVADNHFVSIIAFAHAKYSKFPPEAIKMFREDFGYEAMAKRLFEKASNEISEAPLREIINRYYLSTYTDDALMMLGDLYFDVANFRMALYCWERIVKGCPDADVDRGLLHIKMAIAKKALNLDSEENIISQYKELFGENMVKTGRDEQNGLKLLKRVINSLPLQALGNGTAQTLLATQDPTIKQAIQKWSISFLGTETPELELNPEIFRVHKTTVREPQPRFGGGMGQRFARGGPQPIPLPISPAPITPLVHKNIAYILIGQLVYAVDMETGAIIQSIPKSISKARQNTTVEIRKMIPTLRLWNNKIFFGYPEKADLQKIAVDLESGKSLIPSVVKGDFLERVMFNSGPEFNGQTAYYVMSTISSAQFGQSTNTYLCAFDADSGTLLWKTKLFAKVAPPAPRGRMFWRPAPQSETPLVAHLCIDKGTIFATTNNNAVVAVDALTGNLKWMVRTAVKPKKRHKGTLDPNKLNLAAASNGVLVTAPGDSPYIYAFDADTGEELWKTTEYDYILGLRRSTVYLAGPKICAADIRMGPAAPKGEGLWETKIPEEAIYWPGTLSKNYLFHPSEKGIYQIELKTGNRVQLIGWPKAITPGNLSLAPDGFFVSSGKGIAYIGDQSYMDALTAKINANPKDVQALIKRAYIMFAQRQLKESQKDLEVALQILAPLKDKASLGLADMCLARLYQIYLGIAENKIDDSVIEAEAYYNKAINSAKNDFSRTTILIRLYNLALKTQEWTKAVDALQTIMEKYPQAYGISKEVDGSHIVRGKMFAEEKIASIIRINGRAHYTKHDQKALSMIEKAKATHDLAAARRIVEEYPNTLHIPKAYILLCEQEFSKGNNIEALNALLDYLARYKNKETEGPVYFALSEIYGKLGNRAMQKIALIKLAKLYTGQKVTFAGKTTLVDDYVAKNKIDLPELADSSNTEINGIPKKMWEIDNATNVEWLRQMSVDTNGTEDKVFFIKDSFALECRKRTTGELVWNTGGLSPGWLGIHIAADIKNGKEGVVLTNVLQGGPASVSGLKQDDFILSFDGKRTRYVEELIAVTAASGSGKKVIVEIIRDQKALKIPLTVGGKSSEAILQRLEKDKIILVHRDKLQWFDAGNGKRLWSKDFVGETVIQAASKNGLLAVATSQALVVYDINSGKKLWHANLEALNYRRQSNPTGIIFGDDTIVVEVSSRNLNIFDIFSGRTKSSGNIDSRSAVGRIISNNHLFYISADRNIKGINLGNGKTTFTTPSMFGKDPANIVWGNSGLILLSSNQSMVLLDAATGKTKYKADLGSWIQIKTVETDKNNLYVLFSGIDRRRGNQRTAGTLIAIDKNTGKELWSSNLTGILLSSELWLSENQLIISSSDTPRTQGKVFVIEKNTGNVVHTEKAVAAAVRTAAQRYSQGKQHVYNILKKGWGVHKGSNFLYYGMP